jgi:Ca2+/Na+ antiporter
MELTPQQETPRTWASVFKRKVLTDRQLWKAKFTTALVFCFTAFSLVMDRVQAGLS